VGGKGHVPVAGILYSCELLHVWQWYSEQSVTKNSGNYTYHHYARPHFLGLITNCMEQCTSWEADSSSASREIFPHFRVLESSLPCSQQPAIEPDQFSPCPPTLSFRTFYCHPPIYGWVFLVVSFLHVPPPNPARTPHTRHTHANYTWWAVQITKFLKTRFSSFSCHPPSLALPTTAQTGWSFCKSLRDSSLQIYI